METQKPKIEFSKRLSAFTALKPFCSMAKEDDFIEVTQWTNGEGFDIQISDASGTRTIFMTDGEFLALKKLVKSLDKEIEREWKERQ
jgi:hypothetical protein